MTIAILRDSGDLIWFDAITQYSERYSGTLSTHPLESGGVVTDHVTSNNLQIQLSGIISDADFNLSRPTIQSSDTANFGITNKQFVNNSPVTSQVYIASVPSPTRYLPESISQFIAPTEPAVVVPGFDRPKFAAKIRDELTQMAGGILGITDKDGRPKAQEVFSLVDFQEGKIWKLTANCIITSLDFTESPETGDALWPVMSIERAVFATTKSTTVPATAKKGRQNGDSTVRPKAAGDDASVEPTNINNSALQSLRKTARAKYDQLKAGLTGGAQ